MTDYEHFQEAYEITKTLEIVTTRDFDGGDGDSAIRIEILHCLQSGNYSVRWTQKSDFRLQPSYPVVNGQFANEAGNYSVWVPLNDMPWVNAENEDQAVRSALSWLKERTSSNPAT